MAQQALEHRDNNGFSSEESDYNDDDKDQNNDGNGLVMESYEKQNALKCIYSSWKNAEYHCSKQKDHVGCSKIRFPAFPPFSHLVVQIFCPLLVER